MHNLDDNELDRLSREAADQYEPDTATPGWDGLQKRLDREMPIRKDDRDRKYWLLLLLFLLVGVGAAFYFQKGTGTSLPVTTGSEKNLAEKNNPAATKTAASDKAGTATPSSSTPVGDEQQSAIERAATDTKRATHTDALNNQKQPTEINQRTGEHNSSGNFAKVSRQKKGGQQKSRGGSSFSNDPSAMANNDLQQSNSVQRSANPAFHINEIQAGTHSFDFASLQNRNPSVNVASQSHAATQAVKTEKTDKQISNPELRPFEFGILVGTDKSQVHGTKDDGSGYNLGVTFAYNINRRWQINTGLVYNKKYYSAKGEDYHPPKGYWTDTVTLSMVNANCLMWDIPINVRYNIVAKKEYSIFANVGISSYLMRSEDYGYHYYYYTGQYGYRSKSTPTHDAYWMSVGNLSAGYEQNLGSFSVQAEPYVKFALRGVGMGKVDLNSYGMNIGLKYKPSWSLKKPHPPKK